MKYICMKCKKELDIDLNRRIICPFCGNRIIAKTREGVVKHVLAR